MHPSLRSPQRTRARTPHNRTTTGCSLSDELWAVLAPLLPARKHTHRFGGAARVGRTAAGPRPFVTCSARAANGKPCPQPRCVPNPPPTTGFRHGAQRRSSANSGRRGWHSVTSYRAWMGTGCAGRGRGPRRRLEGQNTGPPPTARANRGVTRRLGTDGRGVPLGLAIDGAHRHEMQRVRATLDRLVVKRPAPTAEQPQGLGLDKGDD
jgi:hypothetical protein